MEGCLAEHAPGTSTQQYHRDYAEYHSIRYEYHCDYAPSKRASLVQELPPPAAVEAAPPNVTRLQVHPLTAPGARFHHRGILDPVKTRFVKANSAIAFPRIIGMDLESDSIPRLHSFGWHLGLRQESPETPIDITRLFSWADMLCFSNTYFRAVRPELGLLEELDFNEQAAARFALPGAYNDLDTVILGVAALGSFFSSNPHPRELDFVQAARNLLVEKSLGRFPTANIVAAWILRTIYLRLTARPHGAWLSSSITMHQVEAAGLHKEIQTIAVVYPAAPTGDHKLAKMRRRLFWISRALNVILSFEFGRVRTNFDVITTKKFAPETGEFAHEFVELAEMLPNDFVDREREPDPPSALSTALKNIEEFQSESSFIKMLKADLVFAIYRRLWLMSLTDAKDRAECVIGIGRAALIASAKLLKTRTPWWNVVHMPFQFLCVLLAVGTPRSLSYLSDAMSLLHKIAESYGTHMTREAYNQAIALVKMSRKRKEKELAALSALPDVPPFDDHPSAASSNAMTEAPNIDWATDLGFEWDIFLNPDLILSSQQGQSAVDATFGSTLGF